MEFPTENMRWLLLALLALGLAGPGATAQEKSAAARAPDLRAEPMVEVAKVCPSIVIELRYGTARNVTGQPIYPPNARCLLRRSVADRLNKAQAELQTQKLSLKIWDAYRPAWAQQILWDAVRNPGFVGEPARGGSLHTFGAGVDVTLVDAKGRELRMPTDFDDFTAAASGTYRGKDPVVAANLLTLQKAMAHAGFWVLRDEWWHFVSQDVKSFAASQTSLLPEPKTELPGKPAAPPAATGSADR